MLRLNVVAAGLGLLALVGCTGGGLTPAAGTLKWEDGTPIGGASLRFIPKEKERAEVNGFTDAQGNFKLNTGPVEGAARGEYSVVVTKTGSGEVKEVVAETPEDRIKAMQGMAKKAPPPKNELPDIYADPAKTPLQAKVDGTTPIQITLKKQ